MATPSSTSSDEVNNSSSCSWSSAASWTIAGGSLDASITFECSDSPMDSETVDAEGKPNLILKTPSANCGPCEITTNFTQKYKVRQVYIRSTARIYEIYFAHSQQISNEYLCTVRCCIASRDDVLHATDAEEPVGTHSDGSDGEQSNEKCSNDGTISPNLDDWIEVKAPDSALNRHSSMPVKIDANPGISIIQDFYEATTEITDADACTSLTIRFLSLQNKDCLYVGEIYVFADPVESADSETQVANSTGSSLMAMLVPTLLQLSRIDSSIASQQRVKLREVDENTPKFQIPEEVSCTEERNHFVGRTEMPYDCIERTMEQLVSRVSRIEDILLTFEENMIKPICSMETRLQRVEQHVEMLTKNTQTSTRIYAPEFSSSSFYNEGNDDGENVLEKNDTASANCSDGMFISVNNNTLFRPGLVVTAPDFSSGDAMQLPDEIPKQALSVDDALAAALAGFLSAPSVHASRYSPIQALVEENGGDGKVVSSRIQSDKPTSPTTLCCELNGKEHINDSLSNSSSNNSILFLEQVMGNFDGQDTMDEGETSCSSRGSSVNYLTTQIELESGQTDTCRLAESTSVCERSEILKHVGNQSEDISGDFHEAAEAVVQEWSVKDTFHDLFKSSSASSTFVVDFELPILDVKFDSGETSGTKSSLEALLTDMPVFNVETPYVQQRGDEKNNLIHVEDGEQQNSPLGGHLLFLGCDSFYAPTSMEGEEAPQYSSYTSNDPKMYLSLI